MTKTQRLRMTAGGFMAALVACGYRGPWRWSHLDWELPFYRVWREWSPAQRAPELFPSLEVGGHGRTSQARELLSQLKKTSPFHEYSSKPLPEHPLGLTSREFLEVWADAAKPDEWIALASAFLAEMRGRDALRD